MRLPSIQDAKDLKGKKVLVRVDFNMPIENGVVTNDFRVWKALPTITFLQEQGVKIILASHLGRESDVSIRPVCDQLNKHIDVTFIQDIVGEKARAAVAHMKDGDVLLLENIRQEKGERANDMRFARELASLADIYVNDAFAVSHREHASIVSVPRLLPHYAGLLFLAEVTELSKALNPPQPSLFILGGAKFGTKEPLLRKFLDIYDHVFVGGALANDFFKAQGFNTGRSMVSGAIFNPAGLLGNTKLFLPVDVTVRNNEKLSEKKPDEVLDEDKIVDAGSETMELLKKEVGKADFVLWNGPLGEYEHGLNEYTQMLARTIAGSSARSVVGGGDTVAAIAELGFEKKLSFVSTAGGAMLQFLLNGTLPGIEALKKTAAQ